MLLFSFEEKEESVKVDSFEALDISKFDDCVDSSSLKLKACFISLDIDFALNYNSI